MPLHEHKRYEESLNKQLNDNSENTLLGAHSTLTVRYFSSNRCDTVVAIAAVKLVSVGGVSLRAVDKSSIRIGAAEQDNPLYVLSALVPHRLSQASFY